ncbi:MAG: GIY-YIG nuclease family protein [bacterium]|nr:GIY-YIG nuclease family protein [bacterium]
MGYTNNLKKRFTEHNQVNVRSTKARGPFTLVYYEAYRAEGDARNRESALKLRGQARKHLFSRLGLSLLRNQS